LGVGPPSKILSPSLNGFLPKLQLFKHDSSFRLAFVNFLNSLEADRNISQTAVSEITKGALTISQRIHQFTVQKIQKRLGQFLFKNLTAVRSIFFSLQSPFLARVFTIKLPYFWMFGNSASYAADPNFKILLLLQSKLRQNPYCLF